MTGAGSAGCCVAARLSESGRYRVLLLEAGAEDRYSWIHVPIGYSRLFANPRVNWMFESEPEPELEGRTMYQPRGKVLGGTSSINGMVYMRGNPADYDLWRQRGCTGWDWDSVLPYFKKAEDQERGADAAHGVGGPLRVSDQPIRWELADAFDRRRGRGRAAAQRRFQRWRAGRRRAVPEHDQPQAALEHRDGLSAAGAAPRQPDDPHQRARDPHRHRGRPGERRRVPVRRGSACGAGARRNHRLRRRLRLAATAAIVGARPGATCCSNTASRWCATCPAVGADLQDHFYVRLAFRCTKPITLNDIANSPVKKLLAGHAIRVLQERAR